jgi:hypothetical protein
MSATTASLTTRRPSAFAISAPPALNREVVATIPMRDRQMAERATGQTASEAFATYCHQVALKTWRRPHHQQALYLRLIEDQTVRDAFWAGRATLKPVLRDLLDSFAAAADTIDDGEEALIASHARTGLAWEAARAVLREPGKA